MTTGFQLDPSEIIERVQAEVTQPGSHVSIYLDSFAHPGWGTEMRIVHDPVDRAVVTFVGSRDHARLVYDAAAKIAGQA